MYFCDIIPPVFMGVFMRKIFICLVCAFAMTACDHDGGTVHRKCGGYDVDMHFSDNGDTMLANINGDELELSNVVSASGAKYAGILNDTIVVLWNKGENWTLVLDDETIIECESK